MMFSQTQDTFREFIKRLLFCIVSLVLPLASLLQDLQIDS